MLVLAELLHAHARILGGLLPKAVVRFNGLLQVICAVDAILLFERVDDWVLRVQSFAVSLELFEPAVEKFLLALRADP